MYSVVITLHSTGSDMHICDCDFMHVISPQLNVKCHIKKAAPHKMSRGSVTSDDGFAYFSLLSSLSVFRFKWSTEKWDEFPPCPFCDCALVIINGAPTAIGGCDGTVTNFTNKLFTLRRMNWVEELPPMKVARSQSAAVSTPNGEYVVVIGGFLDVPYVDHWFTTVELLHVQSRTWSKLTDLPQPLSNPSATICGDDIYVTGDNSGYSYPLEALPSSHHASTSQSRPHTIMWSPLPRLPVTESTTATLYGQLITVGGMRSQSPVNTIHQLVDRRWVEIGSMFEVRKCCLVASPAPYKVMIFGGQTASLFVETNSIEECIVVQEL